MTRAMNIISIDRATIRLQCVNDAPLVWMLVMCLSGETERHPVKACLIFKSKEKCPRPPPNCCST
eukprot:2845273-Amphidinium_carterae.1